MKNNTRSGAALAIAPVSLALAGAATPVVAATAKVHCLGINSCKGKSDCKTPKNKCAGMNACTAQGWVFKETEKACLDEGGTASHRLNLNERGDGFRSSGAP